MPLPAIVATTAVVVPFVITVALPAAKSVAIWIGTKVVTAALHKAGFGPIGIVAESVASTFQSWYYGPSTGGLFSKLTSFAMRA